MTILLSLAIAAALSPASLQTPQGDQVVATVDGVAIKAKDVDKALWDWYSTDVVDEMIANTIVSNALKAQGLTLDPKEVEGFLARLLDEAKASFTPGVDFEAELKKQGMPRSRLAARAATEMGLRKLTESRYKPTEMRKVAWIMVRPMGATEDQRAAARKNAEEILKELETKPWEDVARGKSQDSNSAPRGGELGWFGIGELPKDVADQVRPLAAGKHTGVVDSQGLFAIYRVVAIGPPPAAEEENVKNQFLSRNLQKVYADVKAKAKVERKAP